MMYLLCSDDVHKRICSLPAIVCTHIYRPIFRSLKNRFVMQQQHVRSIQTTSRLLNSEVVKVPPFADSVSEGDVR